MSNSHHNLCNDLRSRARQAVINAIVSSLRPGISERAFLRILIQSLKEAGIRDYWYPAGESSGVKQFGCIVAFDCPSDQRRTTFGSARALVADDEHVWNGFGYIYVSPQSISNDGYVVWGDYGSTLCFDSNPQVRQAVRRTWRVSQLLVKFIRENPRSTTMDVFSQYTELAKQEGVRNIAESVTAVRMERPLFNIGHSFPFVPVGETCNSISQSASDARSRRIFIDGSDSVPLAGGIWSLEARERSIDFPYGAVSFHRLMSMSDHGVDLLADCDESFALIGMDWILC